MPGVDGNIHVAPAKINCAFGILLQAVMKSNCCSGVESRGIDALQVEKPGGTVAVAPLTVGGLHVGGVGAPS